MLDRLLRMARAADRGPRRRRREVHRRCRRRGVRRPRRPRGRPRARRPRGPADRARTPSGSQALGGAPLRLRVGINTGEALVRLGVEPGIRRAGSSPATRSTPRRGIQSVAPEMGVAVGLATYEATAAVFDYEELEPATLKGKAEPVRVFQRDGGPRPASASTSPARTTRPYVGREIDLALLKGLFDKTVAASSRPARHRRRRARASARAGSSPSSSRTSTTRARARDLAPGPLPALRRGDHVLGAGRDREGAGRDPRVGRPAAVASAKLDAVLPEGAERAWFRAAAAPAARDRGRARGRARGAVHGVATVPRARRRGAPDRPRLRGPPLGRRRRCSRSSSTWPSGPKACRCSSSARRAPSSTSAIPTIAAGLPQREPRSTSRRSPTRRPRGSSRRSWRRP